MKESDLLNGVFHYFIGWSGVHAAVLFAATFFTWQKEKHVRNVWVAAIVCSFAIGVFFSVRDYYLCPLYILGWTQLCSATGSGHRPIVQFAVTLLLLLLAWNFLGYSRNTFQNIVIDKAEASEQMKAITNSGVNAIFLENLDDYPFFYGLSTGYPMMSGITKQQLIKDFGRLKYNNSEVLINHRLGITFIPFTEQKQLDGFINHTKTEAVLIRRRLPHGAGIVADVSGCSLLLKNRDFESYLCRPPSK